MTNVVLIVVLYVFLAFSYLFIISARRVGRTSIQRAKKYNIVGMGFSIVALIVAVVEVTKLFGWWR